MKTTPCVARAARVSGRFMLAFLLLAAAPRFAAAQAVTGIITDYRDYWKSSSTAISPVKPDNSHNLLAFTYNGVQYSTGVDDAKLSAHGQSFVRGDFWSLPAGAMTGTVTGNTKIGLGALFDGIFNGFGSFQPDYNLSTYLTDGIKGLNIGTCVANLPAGSMNFNIANIQPSSIGDGIPDILVTQVADPSGSYDRYEFTDANGNRIGNYKDIVFTSIAPVANWTADFFEARPSLLALLGGFTQTDRPMRLWAADLSEFGISPANVAQIRHFKINLSGNSDVAFVAYNNSSVNFQTPLPVRYSFFRGNLANGEVSLSWQTTAELNANEFIVERSADGTHFSSIGSLKAKNTPSVTNNYEFVDAAPLGGASFYRIRQTDMDGTTNLTSIIRIQKEGSAAVVRAYPTPAHGQLQLDHGIATGRETITLYNAAGATQVQQRPAAGAMHTTIPVQDLAAGAYYLVYQSGNEKTTAKVIIN